MSAALRAIPISVGDLAHLRDVITRRRDQLLEAAVEERMQPMVNRRRVDNLTGQIDFANIVLTDIAFMERRA